MFQMGWNHQLEKIFSFYLSPDIYRYSVYHDKIDYVSSPNSINNDFVDFWSITKG